MPRHARIRIPGLPLHIIQRGVNRARCFADEADYRLYLGLLGELSALFDCRVHAYVLMTNHVHLLMTPGAGTGPSLLMKHLGVRYVPHFNKRAGRIGPLWNERFRSSIVESERYLLTCYRYIEQNPVRARMVRAPHEYPWSSFATNALGAPCLFLQPHEEYARLAGQGQSACEAYRALFAQDLTETELATIRRAVNANAVLGSDDFIALIERQTGLRARAAPRGRPRVPPGGKKSPSPV